ncbi:MAG: phage major capsid protein [Gammaproteobacteria bacterium]|nr:phage major capsid protein [Gammaproteobacteria bacterium]
MADVDYLLQFAYSNEGVKDLINRSTKTYSALSTSSRAPEGLGFKFSVNTEGNQANLGAINYNQTLPDGGGQEGTNGLILPKETVQVVNLTNYQIQAGKSQNAAFATTLTENMDKGIMDHAKDLNQQTYRSGLGIIAKVNGTVTASTSIIVDNGIITHFRPGMKIACYNGSTLEANRTVTNVNFNTLTVTVDSACTLTDNDNIYRIVGNVDTKTGAPTDGKELTGLPMVTDDGTLAAAYEGITRSSYPQFNGIALDKNSANLSDDMLESLRSNILEQSGTDVTGGSHKIFTSPRQFRKYMQITIPQLRFDVDGKLDSAGGKATKTWMDLEWIEDTDCGFDEIYMLDMNDVKKYVLYDIKYEDQFGGGVMKWNGKDATVAYSVSMVNIGSEMPNRSARLFDLAYPSV